jgi:hypothetical protein
MKRLFYKIGALTSVYLLAPVAAMAQIGDTGITAGDPGQSMSALSGGETELPVLVGNIINIFIGILGIIFVILTVYAGFLYLTAGGESDKVEDAKAMLRNGVIGLILILAAFAISNFVVSALTEATGV